MAKYRKKPVVIEAEQFFSSHRRPPFYYDGNPVQFRELCEEGGQCHLCGQFYIRTLEGPHIVTDGDWIIKGVQGEFYPIKEDIFEKTYEPVEDDA